MGTHRVIELSFLCRCCERVSIRRPSTLEEERCLRAWDPVAVEDGFLRFRTSTELLAEAASASLAGVPCATGPESSFAVFPRSMLLAADCVCVNGLMMCVDEERDCGRAQNEDGGVR
jgi:hypothetical protein